MFTGLHGIKQDQTRIIHLRIPVFETRFDTRVEWAGRVIFDCPRPLVDLAAGKIVIQEKARTQHKTTTGIIELWNLECQRLNYVWCRSR